MIKLINFCRLNGLELRVSYDGSDDIVRFRFKKQRHLGLYDVHLRAGTLYKMADKPEMLSEYLIANVKEFMLDAEG